MRHIIILLLMGFLFFLFLIPTSKLPADFEKVKIIKGNSYVVLQGNTGMLKISVPKEVVENGEGNIYDFFSLLVDNSQIERIEVFAVLGEISCRVVTLSGRNYAGKINYCLALALRKKIPIYVQKNLLKEKRSIVWGF